MRARYGQDNAVDNGIILIFTVPMATYYLRAATVFFELCNLIGYYSSATSDRVNTLIEV